MTENEGLRNRLANTSYILAYFSYLIRSNLAAACASIELELVKPKEVIQVSLGRWSMQE